MASVPPTVAAESERGAMTPLGPEEAASKIAI